MRTPIDLDRLEREMFRRGVNRIELAGAAGVSLRTLAAVFTSGLATQKTKLKLSTALYSRDVVADPDMLEDAS